MVNLWYSRFKSVLFTYKHVVLSISALGILIDIFLFDLASDLITLALIGLLILCIWLYKLKGKTSIKEGLIFLILCPFFLIFKKQNIAEKAAVWSYLFFLVGTIQVVKKIFMNKK